MRLFNIRTSNMDVRIGAIYSILFLVLSFTVSCQEKAGVSDVFISNGIIRLKTNKSVTDPDALVNDYSLLFSKDGYISSITIKTNKYLSEPITYSISKDGDASFTIGSSLSKENSHIKILGQDKVIIDGPVLSLQKGEPEIIMVHSLEGVVYSGRGIQLEKGDGFCNENIINPSQKLFGCRYGNGVLYIDYMNKGNIQAKIIYEKKKGAIFATYYNNIGNDDYDKISTPIKIVGYEQIGKRDDLINITNYFIIKALNPSLSEILFPIIFSDFNS